MNSKIIRVQWLFEAMVLDELTQGRDGDKVKDEDQGHGKI